MGTSILKERSRLARHHVRELEKARGVAYRSTGKVDRAMEVSPCPPALELRDLCRDAIRDLRRVELAARRVATSQRLLASARRPASPGAAAPPLPGRPASTRRRPLAAPAAR